MKNNIFKTLAVCAITALTAFTSCNTDAEGEIYNPDTVANCSFASSQMNVELSADYGNTIKVPVYRGSSEGTATVQIEASMDEETAAIFSANTSVTFNAGESVAYVEVNYSSMDDLGATTKYTIELGIPEGFESPSAEKALALQIQRKLTWENIGTGVYYSQLFGQSWEQPVEKAKEGNIYRLPDCIYEGYPFVFSLSEDGQTLTGWDPQKTGYSDSTYGMVYFQATEMQREGNALSFPMLGLVEYNGRLATLYSGFVETIVLP